MIDPQGEPLEPVVVPHTELQPALLRSVIEAFVLREGTDYGAVEMSLEQKVSRVLRQLEQGRAEISFDPNDETVSIVPKR